MLESVAFYLLLAFTLGVSFAFGIWSFGMVAAKFLPMPGIFENPGVGPPSAMETA